MSNAQNRRMSRPVSAVALTRPGLIRVKLLGTILEHVSRGDFFHRLGPIRTSMRARRRASITHPPGGNLS